MGKGKQQAVIIGKEWVINTINLGDVTKIHGGNIPLVNVLTYGAPCQDLSIAGKRAGMKNTIMGDEDSTRSGLFFDAIRIVKEQRNESLKQLSNTEAVVDIRHIQPRYTIYENVCGAFSSNNGEDFRAVLEETVKVADENAYVPGLAKGQKWANAGCIMGDGYSVAWRVHDAQFWGVPQRRKRICVLADYGGDTAPEILFELLGEADDPESYKIVTDIREQSRPEVQTFGKGLSGNTEQGKQKGQGAPRNVENSLGTASTNRGGIKTYDVRISSEGTKNQRAHCYETDRSRALDTGGENPDSNHGGIAVVGCDLYNQTITGNVSKALNSIASDSDHVPCVCFEPGSASRVGGHVYEDDVSGSLRANAGDNQQSVVCIEGNGVRESHKGDGYKESDTMYTLNTVEQHAVAYGISAYDSNAMKSPNPHSGVYEADTSRTLDLNGGSPACNQGGVAVVSYGLDRASFNQGKNAKFGFSVDEELAPSLVAKGRGGISETVGSLCARDYKGVGNQYVDEGKCVIQCSRPSDTES